MSGYPELASSDGVDTAIDVRHLSKSFGDKVAVNNVSLTMPRGQVWGFLGPNGSGKTTTIRMICGLLRPTTGEGSCLGLDIRRESEAIKRQTGYMTQRFSLWNDLTIRENLDFVARLYQLKPRKTVVQDTLEKLGLTHRQSQLAGDLSGGWKQRLALAAVTMHQPQLLLLDEPTAGVDPQARREFWDEIHRLSLEGLTVLVSTHYMDEAERCDEIVYLAHGELVTQGPVKRIIDASGLVTFRSSSPGIRQLSERLQSLPGVQHVAYFGNALHVSGGSVETLKKSLQGVAPGAHWESIEPSLEDTFIALTHRQGGDRRKLS